MKEILEILVWPAALIVLVVILRKPLADLLRTARKVKYKDFEIEFQKGIDSLKQEASEALPDTAEPENGKVEVDLFELAEVSPSAAVLEAWRSVETSAKALIAGRGHEVDYDVATPYKMIQDILVGGKIIEEKKGKIFNELRQLRNKVAHATGYRLTTEQAEEYVRLALRMKDYLDRATQVTLQQRHPTDAAGAARLMPIVRPLRDGEVQ